ncbi:MAG: T9SS type A sorting domain-containing protein [Flavobacteriales bacterium]|nr:T9SS type A sorting domain-containing protein [Flavobacteriales bacterium]
MFVRPTILCAFIALVGGVAQCQVIDTVLLSEIGRYQHPYVSFPAGYSAPTLSSRIDRLDRNVLYMACGDSGLMTLDLTQPPVFPVVNRIGVGSLQGLKVMNVEQIGALLYLSLGDISSGSQASGLAIMDVSVADDPVVLDVWSDAANFSEGCAITVVKDGLAYLGGMENGVIVLDVSDPADIQFVSSYQPDPTWPGIASYPPNARGMAIVDTVLYLAYDAGGLRSIDISDPNALTEIGRYVNPNIPILTNPAYNNVVVIGDRAYCTIDYCGLEIVDISDPANMTQVAWLNPWNCIGLSWFGSDGHTNELITAHNDSLLFVSGADTEILVYDISDGDAPVLVGGHILPNDSASTWGVDVHGDRVVANFINNHGLPFQPYDSRYGGVVVFEWTVDYHTSVAEACIMVAGAYAHPNPTTGVVNLDVITSQPGPTTLRVHDVNGRPVLETKLFGKPWQDQRVFLDLSGHAPGIYHVSVVSANERLTTRIVMLGN